MKSYWFRSPGATILRAGKCQFVVWAPQVSQIELHLVAPEDKLIPLKRGPDGYHEAIVDGVEAGSRYFFLLDGERERPDPASRLQPEGVHGPSEVVDQTFAWQDSGWYGIPLSQYVIYELHVGTFTAEGTFDAVIAHLDELKNLGITAIEILPVAQIPGDRNWGYDGAYLFAAQNSYGGPHGLKRLVDACHTRGLAVILDVVYNHLGPEGNYLSDYGPYFTDRYKTPWGSALNYDGAESEEVRRFFVCNALYWQKHFHIDALRLDAVHAITDFSAQPFLQELAEATRHESEQLNRRFYLIAESDLNDTRVLRPAEQGGFGHHAQWSDDFHHALHTVLTGEDNGYYRDFGTMNDLATSLRDTFVYAGRYSTHRRRRHGNSARAFGPDRFVICCQNHDQVGNRALGDRLSQCVDFESLKLAAASVILSPYLPMIFMGEEYGETAPFPYFVSHGDEHLIESVREGRRAEFAAFAWDGEIPDPQDEATFQSAKLHHDLKNQGHHQSLWNFYQHLLRLRKANPVLSLPSKEFLDVTAFEREKVLIMRRWRDQQQVCIVFNFSDDRATLPLPFPTGNWTMLLNSKDANWYGPGTSLPKQIQSDGEVSLQLDPKVCAVYFRIG